MKRVALSMVTMLAACNPSPTPPVAAEKSEPELTAPVTDMVPISDLANSNQRFAHCKERWADRLKSEEDNLRAERALREAIARRPDMMASGQLALEEERAEKRRLEMAKLYSETDPDGCFG